MANKPHKHAELIKAWADGARIEFWCSYMKEWRDVIKPNWYPTAEYRIKPTVSIPREARAFHKAIMKEMRALVAGCRDRRTPCGDVVSPTISVQAVHYGLAIGRVAKLVKEAQEMFDKSGK